MIAVEKQYDTLILANRAKMRTAIEELDSILVSKDCKFGDKATPCFIKPFFLTEHVTRQLQHVTSRFVSMLEKVIQAYFSHPELRPIFGLTKIAAKYMDVDPGYMRNIIIARPDGFLNGNRLEFIEFNCDSPAGAGYADIQEQILRKCFFVRELRSQWHFRKFGRLSALLRALVDCYHEHGGAKKHPSIAIVDWRTIRTMSEFVIIKKYFESRGYPTVIADPRDLRLRSGKLYAKDFRIDLVYRRAIFRELMQKQDEIGDFLKAYRLGKVCVVNPLRSRLAGNKAVLSILTNAAYEHFFTPDELKVRDKHIPWTRRVIEGKKFYGGKSIYLQKMIAENRDALVLKPSDSYGGRDVKIGRETSKSEWTRTVERVLKSGEHWVVQEYVRIPEMRVPILEQGRVRLVHKKINLNPFVFGGRYAGSVCRLSDQSVINVSAGGGLVPAMSCISRK
ncbi:MAG: circularly permuted type 2 ATP-grasp protein [Candidatus Omnitrophota bacterium]|nr:circularly permuted type 2 ATP-grasp protein [Candidatus Omnitrophota bacterium]